MSDYTPPAPTPSGPPPCEGEPFRWIDGVVECLGDVQREAPLAVTGASGEEIFGLGVLGVVAVCVGLACIAALARWRRDG